MASIWHRSQKEAIPTAKVGLALGAGGARGLAHLGVLKVFEEDDIPVDMIAGTSIGAIIGAMYAQNPDAGAVTERFREYLMSPGHEVSELQRIVHAQEKNLPALQRFARTIARRVYISSMGSRPALLKPDALKGAIDYLVNDASIEDAKLPFGAVVTDLNSGKALLVRKGSIRRAVRWSALVPGFLPPERHDQHLFADGAVTNPVPVDFIRAMGAGVTIAVSVDQTVIPPLEDTSVISIMQRCDLIRGLQMSHMETEKADVVIHPDVADCHWSRFIECDRFIEQGIQEASRQLPAIRKILRKRSGRVAKIIDMLMRGGK